jgi:hypothetical protein
VKQYTDNKGWRSLQSKKQKDNKEDVTREINAHSIRASSPADNIEPIRQAGIVISFAIARANLLVHPVASEGDFFAGALLLHIRVWTITIFSWEVTIVPRRTVLLTRTVSRGVASPAGGCASLLDPIRFRQRWKEISETDARGLFDSDHRGWRHHDHDSDGKEAYASEGRAHFCWLLNSSAEYRGH